MHHILNRRWSSYCRKLEAGIVAVTEAQMAERTKGETQGSTKRALDEREMVVEDPVLGETKDATNKRRWRADGSSGEGEVMVTGGDVEEARRLVAEEASATSLTALVDYASDSSQGSA